MKVTFTYKEDLGLLTNRISGRWMDTTPYDMLGEKIVVGDRVVKSVMSGRASNLSIAEVTRIEDDKIYLSGSKVPVRFPGRLLVVTKLFAPIA